MTAYRFEDLLANPPTLPGESFLHLNPTDSIAFGSGSANQASVVYGIGPADAEMVAISLEGHTLSFDTSIEGISAQGRLLFADGSKLLIGGLRDELLEGRDGNDAFYGGAGNDTILAHGGDNLIQGNQGDDNILSDEGADTIFGGQGNDHIVSGVGVGPEAGDLVNGNKGDDSIAGGGAADTLLGGQGNDSIQGGGGDDWISGDRGNDTLAGDAGGDAFVVSADGGDDRVADFNGAEGDRVHIQPGTALEFHQVGADTLILVGHGSSTMTLVGVQAATLNPEWFVIDGGGVNSGGETIIGSEVTDILVGGLGNDSIQGGGGGDWMLGAQGDDTLVGGAGGDVFFANAHGGDDRALDFNGAEGDRVRVEARVAFDIHADGADTLIIIDHGSSTMRLVGVQASTLHADWVVGV